MSSQPQQSEKLIKNERRNNRIKTYN
ncbi:hypothetical protein CL3_18430 [butyrate-producing bacterium SM4/1]|nr:hypothetical protein CLS_05810 [[Clostridium] cf. saccharolyticum K10]CBL36315.1 hypothetical protein CL3_18430 [butyrate-producing bacterium SM4/1]